MALVKVGRNTVHHWAVKTALQQAHGEHEVECGWHQALQQGDAMDRCWRLVPKPRRIGHHNQDQADNAAGRGPGELDEKEVEGEVHAGRTHPGFPFAVVVGKGHNREVQRQGEALNHAVNGDLNQPQRLVLRAGWQEVHAPPASKSVV